MEEREGGGQMVVCLFGCWFVCLFVCLFGLFAWFVCLVCLLGLFVSAALKCVLGKKLKAAEMDVLCECWKKWK